MRGDFQRTADEFLAALFDFYPTWAARLGLHEYDGRPGDFSQEALDRRLRELSRFEKALEAHAEESLSPPERLDREVLLAAVERERFELADLRPFHRNPMAYADAVDVTLYVKRNYAPPRERARRLARHLRAVPSVLAAARRNLDRACPRVFVATALEMFEGALTFLRDDLPGLVAGWPGADGALAPALEDATRSVGAFCDFLRQDLLPQTSEQFALGPDRYRRLLWCGERLQVDLDVLRRIADGEVGRLRDALAEVAAQVDRGRPAREVVRRLSAEHPSEAELVPCVRRILEELRDFLRRHPVVRVPEPADCLVEPTPPFLRWAFALMDTAGPFEDPSVESYYYVTLPEPGWSAEEKEAWLSRFDVYTLRTTSVHEAYPGHHVHFLRLREAPSQVAKVFTSYAFVEGWAHYCEEMMLECGYGDGDPRLRLAQLVDALTRAVRFRASLGLHTEGWTVEEAARRFVQDAELEPLPARKEAERGTFDPGYLHYTLGKKMLQKLRRDCERRWSSFSLLAFHDRLLDLGAPPPVLARKALLGEDADPL
jgi:uncharacterized protein (DUF885 family)